MINNDDSRSQSSCTMVRFFVVISVSHSLSLPLCLSINVPRRHTSLSSHLLHSSALSLFNSFLFFTLSCYSLRRHKNLLCIFITFTADFSIDNWLTHAVGVLHFDIILPSWFLTILTSHLFSVIFQFCRQNFCADLSHKNMAVGDKYILIGNVNCKINNNICILYCNDIDSYII